MKKRNSGFTLIEILLVVAALAILAGIVIFAINPSKQLAETRNAQRAMDVNTILNALYQYSIDHNGTFPAGITTTATEICGQGVVEATCTSDSLVNLSPLTEDEVYLVGIPEDPQNTDDGAGYTVNLTAGGRIVVSAPDAERDASISVTR